MPHHQTLLHLQQLTEFPAVFEGVSLQTAQDRDLFVQGLVLGIAAGKDAVLHPTKQDALGCRYDVDGFWLRVTPRVQNP